MVDEESAMTQGTASCTVPGTIRGASHVSEQSSRVKTRNTCPGFIPGEHMNIRENELSQGNASDDMPRLREEKYWFQAPKS